MSTKRKFDEIASDESDGETAAVEPKDQVLSHAAQRRLRKRLKTMELNEKATDEGGITLVATGAKKSANSAVHSVWVGNLSFKTTPDALRKFLGNMEDIKRIHMPTKALHGHLTNSKESRGDNRGFAYVDFGTAEAKQAAIAKSEGHLDGRRLLIKDGSDFTGRPEKDGGTSGSSNPLTGLTKTAKKILSQQKNPACATLFVGNLGFETKEDEIAALFGRLHPKLAKRSVKPVADDADQGRLLRVRMGTFEDSGKCKGFAFVDFKDAQSATEALTNPHNHSLNGRALVVEYASADAVRRGALVNAKQETDKPATKNHASRRPQKSERIAAKAAARQGKVVGQTITSKEGMASGSEGKTRTRDLKSSQRTPKSDTVRRQKSGAALATAQRESVAIVPSTGKKIVF